MRALEHQNEEHLKYWMKETKLLLLALASRFEIQRTYFENVLRISLIEVLLQNSTKLYFILKVFKTLSQTTELLLSIKSHKDSHFNSFLMLRRS